MLAHRLSPEDKWAASYEKCEYVVVKICMCMSVSCQVAHGYSREEVVLQTDVSTKSIKRYVQICNESSL